MNNKLITNYYIAHRDELLAFASSRLGDSRQAEDIVQDVFLRLLSSDKMITEVTLPALVYTITRNLINDYYRRHTTYEQYEHYIKGVCSEVTTSESVFSAFEIMERLERGLVRLPENCREIYRLHIYGGMKVGEISRELGEGYKSVEHRLGTARKVMREYLRCYASA
jgi:RNA polymerase sigma-70 factor (ECF subfamily)